MPDAHSTKNEFLLKATEIIEEHISDEQFGVSELAHEIGMSRSNLLRKIKKLTDLSASQFIRQVRLKQAMEILRNDSYTVSEIAYMVGFSSASYFIKCFREEYGYPPGEVGKREEPESDSIQMDHPEHAHQLAAIMFTDIQGYTALMQQDEKKAVGVRARHREVFNAITKKHRGKILQYFGDGTLSTFNSAIDAVRCGVALQLAFRQEPQIPVRIGIHTGDIIFTEDDIIGDGVNVASRIESLAAAGSVFISEKVYDEVKNQSGIQTTSMGTFELMNVDKAMEVFAIANPGLLVPERHQVEGKVKNGTTAGNKGVKTKGKWAQIKWVLIILLAILVAWLISITNIFERGTSTSSTADATITKKSIAVLPFINDSDDSSNVYIINGLMESILNNLQKIENIRVISRTSVEKYRNNPKTISEIAEELNVSYIVEGSGQKIGDQILLNIQLIEAPGDRHLWAEQYDREVKDIFKLQMEVAKIIAGKIKVIITPEEEKLIEKIPTDDPIAYDHFLKGLDLFFKGNAESLEESIVWFKKAIERDNTFARAYADIAMAYYYLDLLPAEKQYSEQIGYYADKALLLDSKLAQALIAKAMSFMNAGENEQALPYLEKALKYNPNSSLVINMLSDFYVNHMPDTEKYLEYALLGIQLDIAAHDSVATSFIYLHVSNAFVQSGFVDEAEMYINKSLDYYPENLYSEYLRAYIFLARTMDFQQTRELLIAALKKDSSRLDIMQEVGKICYYQRDWECAYQYYKKFIYIRETYNLDMYRSEDSKIALVYAEIGEVDKSEKLLKDYKQWAEYNESIYKHMNMAAYYSYTGDTAAALEQLKLFAKQDNYFYWIILFLDIDPFFDNISQLPEFNKILEEMKTSFRERHEQAKERLEEKGLI